jgi:hypothetical protein
VVFPFDYVKWVEHKFLVFLCYTFFCFVFFVFWLKFFFIFNVQIAGNNHDDNEDESEYEDVDT